MGHIRSDRPGLAAFEFDKHPLTYDALRARGPAPVELQTAFDVGGSGGWLIELLTGGQTVTMSAAQAHVLGAALIGMAARVAVLEEESRTLGH